MYKWRVMYKDAPSATDGRGCSHFGLALAGGRRSLLLPVAAVAERRVAAGRTSRASARAEDGREAPDCLYDTV